MRFEEARAQGTPLPADYRLAARVWTALGIPSFLAGSVGKAVEGFLSKQITANLTSTTDALSRYLTKKTSGG